MNEDLTGVDGEPITIPTRRPGYSEGPIVFKRQGVYYYLYTLSGHETYHYAYCMSRKSPVGPFETPDVDIIAESDPEQGIFGPGHGTVFSPSGTDDHYFVYLEYGRGGVTRQVCIDRMAFNADGTIEPLRLTTTGIPPLKPSAASVNLARGEQVVATASSCRSPIDIRGLSDRNRLLRREDYLASRAIDGSNFTRWLPASDDANPWFMVDLGEPHAIHRTELSMYRPTLGHAYQLESSLDGRQWTTVVRQAQAQVRSPQVATVETEARYLRLTFLKGHPGIWEFKVHGNEKGKR
jgi:hypothetical protein